MTSSANSSRLLRTTQWICELYIVELRIYEVFDYKERKSFEKYEKKISVSLNVLAGVHGLSSTLQARSAYRLPCRRARPIVYLAGVHGLSSTLQVCTAYRLPCRCARPIVYLAGVHGLSSTLQACTAYRLPCRRARPIVYLAGVHGLSSNLQACTAYRLPLCGLRCPLELPDPEDVGTTLRRIVGTVKNPKRL
jgi:hypothetical protein